LRELGSQVAMRCRIYVRPSKMIGIANLTSDYGQDDQDRNQNQDYDQDEKGALTPPYEKLYGAINLLATTNRFFNLEDSLARLLHGVQ
jgi:hypothetical protein